MRTKVATVIDKLPPPSKTILRSVPCPAVTIIKCSPIHRILLPTVTK